ncbi:MAG: HaeII family restriction endonuclease [Saprospiraceae bacterium]
MIVSLLNQIGWKSRIQSIVTESNLLKWYEKALRGNFGSQVGEKVLATLKNEILTEFPATETKGFGEFIAQRGYDNLSDPRWG